MIKQIKKILSCRENSFFKTVYYNVKYLPLKRAIKLPMIIAKSTRIRGHGSILLDSDDTIYIGQKTLNWTDEKKEYTLIYLEGGGISFKGNCYIGLGSKFEIKQHGYLVIGENVTFTGKANVICSKKMVFGDDCLISWNTLFMDSDGHTILGGDSGKNINKPIIIGQHVWIGCNVTVLKGTNIANGTVIASNSVIKGSFKEENTIIAGKKARQVREKIKWSIDRPS